MPGNIYIGTNSIKKSLSLGDNYIYRIYDGNSLVYENKAFLAFYSQDPFTLNIIDNTKHWDGTIQYSTDATTWTTWDGTTTLSSSGYDGAVNALLLRGIGNTYLTGGSSASTTVGVWRFTGTQNSINVQGSIEYLLDYKTTIKGNHPAAASRCFRYMFYGDTCLFNFSTLTLSTIPQYGYAQMFDSSKIIIAPDISAVTYGVSACEYMFRNCTNLNIVPSKINTTSLGANYACYYMFYGCTNITSCPDMSLIHSFGHYACEYMFYGCTSLTETPTIEINSAGQYSFAYAFQGCTAITTINITMAALTASSGCFRSMFRGCTAITAAINLPSTTIREYSYAYMFEGCTNLVTGPSSLPATTIGSNAYYYMFHNCSKLTKCPTLPTTQITVAQYGFAYMFSGCSSLYMNTPTILNATSMGNHACDNMFTSTKIDKAPELPATTLGDYCYRSMFLYCSNLEYAPIILPAATVPTYAYEYMFDGCTNLIMAPRIDATSVGSYGCAYMFRNCSTMKYSPNILATTISDHCYYYMFYGCTALLSPSELPATTLATYCYAYMYYDCTSLRDVPSLPATTLSSYCYYYMFCNCSNIIMNTYPSGSCRYWRRIPSTGSGTSATGALTNMFTNISSSGNFRGTPTIDTSYSVERQSSIARIKLDTAGTFSLTGDTLWKSAWVPDIPYEQGTPGFYFEFQSGDSIVGYVTTYNNESYSSNSANFGFWTDYDEAQSDIDLIFIFDIEDDYPVDMYDYSPKADTYELANLYALRSYLRMGTTPFVGKVILNNADSNNKYLVYLYGY